MASFMCVTSLRCLTSIDTKQLYIYTEQRSRRKGALRSAVWWGYTSLKCLIYAYTEQRSEWQGALLSGIWCGCRPLKCLIFIYTEQRSEWQGALRAAVSLPNVRLCAFGARCWTRDVRGLEGTVYEHIYIYELVADMESCHVDV